ncbi:MOSC domain-containing protein [Novosphingobium lubricantis]
METGVSPRTWKPPSNPPQPSSTPPPPCSCYADWLGQREFRNRLSGAGAFGENISTIGMIEDAVCIGDRFRMGTTLLEVSQGRQPCWKLDHRFGMKGVTAAVVSNGLAGWYYRVLEPGTIEAGDVVELVDRTHPTWTVARVFGLIISGHGKTDQESLRALHGVKSRFRNSR